MCFNTEARLTIVLRRYVADTGSSNIGVGGFSLADSSSAVPLACESDACQVCNPYDPNGRCLFAKPFCWPGNQSMCGGSISYGGSGSYFNGPYITDVVSFGGFTTRMTFMNMEHAGPDIALRLAALSRDGATVNGGTSHAHVPVLWGPAACRTATCKQSLSLFGAGCMLSVLRRCIGILGLAHEWNAVNPTYVPSFFHTLVQEKQVMDLFGLCLTPKNGGNLDLGFSNSSKYTGELAYMNVTQQRWYNVPLVDIRFNNTSIGMPASSYWFDNDAIGSLIDSGTGVLAFSPAIYSAIIKTLQTNFCHIPCASCLRAACCMKAYPVVFLFVRFVMRACTDVCGDQSKTIFGGYCLSGSSVGVVGQLPDFQFVFTGADGEEMVLTTPATSYMLEQSGSYCWGVTSFSGVNAILGDVFMENFYIEHDRANQRLGFAPVSSACVE